MYLLLLLLKEFLSISGVYYMTKLPRVIGAKNCANLSQPWVEKRFSKGRRLILDRVTNVFL